MEHRAENEENTEQGGPHSLLTPQQAMLAGGTLATTWIADVVMHGGPNGLFLGALATFIVARHTGDIIEAVRPGKHSGHVIESTARILHMDHQNDNELDQSVRAKLQRLFRLSPTTSGHDLSSASTPQPKRGYLNLSPDYQPHVDDVLGHCILCVGQRGTGKSNVAARLCEQLGQYPIPMLIIDYKQDYITLPTKLKRSIIAGSAEWEEKRHHHDVGYWELNTSNAFEAGYNILENGVQVIFQVISYEHIDSAAEVLIEIIRGMFKWAQQQPAGKRIPALVLLDEAQQFLPQQQGISQINQDLSKKLLSIFERLNSIGRSLGLTPAFFTQRVAQIKKEVIGGSEIFWLLKQSIDQDLSVYEALLGKDTIHRKEIQAFQSGQALVFSYGDVLTTRFYERESEHLSVTPSLSDALSFYGQKDFSRSMVRHESTRIEKSALDEWEELMQEEDAPSNAQEGPIDPFLSSQKYRGQPDPTPSPIIVDALESCAPALFEKPQPSGPDLGPDNQAFSREQEHEFLRLYRKSPQAIREILKLMNGGKGLSKRYEKYANWLLKEIGASK